MAALTQYPSFRSLRIAVPITSALFSVLGISTGAYAYLSPGFETSKLFGILLPHPTDTNSEADVRQRSYIQIHGIRNVTSTLSMLGVISFWRFSSTCQSSPSAAAAVQKVLAIIYGAGCYTGIVDGLILRRYAQSDGLSSEARELALEQSKGHITLAFPVIALAFGWWYL